MLKDISKYNFYGRSHFVRLRGKYTAQCTHCALYMTPIAHTWFWECSTVIHGAVEGILRGLCWGSFGGVQLKARQTTQAAAAINLGNGRLWR